MTDYSNTSQNPKGSGIRTEDARQGNPVGRMRRVLGVSLTLVVIAFALAWLLAF